MDLIIMYHIAIDNTKSKGIIFMFVVYAGNDR